MIDLEAIYDADVIERPFSFMVVENLISAEDLKTVQQDFPPISKPGLFPLQDLEYGPAFKGLVAELRSRDFTYVMGKKFRINLTQKPLLVSVRGQSRITDGRIHTDSKSRLISCMLYLNDEWRQSAGRLLMLRNKVDYSRALAEIPPDGGTLVAIRRSNRSWHGYLPYEGERRCIAFNWMWSRTAREAERIRHRLSAHMKQDLSQPDLCTF